MNLVEALSVRFMSLVLPSLLFRGYIEAIREIEQQLQNGAGGLGFDDIVVACGRFFFLFL